MKQIANIICAVLVIVAQSFAMHAAAQQTEGDDATHNLGATITGNQEQPKVLYIVPWKAAYEDEAIPYRPISGQTDKVFRHIDRHEHQRHVGFMRDFKKGN